MSDRHGLRRRAYSHYDVNCSGWPGSKLASSRQGFRWPRPGRFCAQDENIAMRLATFCFYSWPMFFIASSAASRTIWSLSWSNNRNAGSASLATGPRRAKAFAAAQRTYHSGSFKPARSSGIAFFPPRSICSMISNRSSVACESAVSGPADELFECRIESEYIRQDGGGLSRHPFPVWAAHLAITACRCRLARTYMPSPADKASAAGRSVRQRYVALSLCTLHRFLGSFNGVLEMPTSGESSGQRVQRHCLLLVRHR